MSIEDEIWLTHQRMDGTYLELPQSEVQFEIRDTPRALVIAHVPRMLRMLRLLEWSAEKEIELGEPAEASCPWCGRMQSEGHADHCDLGRLLRDVSF